MVSKTAFYIFKCNGIYYAAFSNKWYILNPKIAEDLLFLMIRGTRPTYLTVGKIFPVTMATFCNVRYFNV